MNILKEIKESLLHLAFPHVCAGCGNDILDTDNLLCLDCISGLPQTGFQQYDDNPVEKAFWGRIPVAHATAQYYFTKDSLMQQLMHQFKYRGNRELGLYLGRLMGADLLQLQKFSNIEALVPLPLFAAKEKQRGYNQAAVLCYGIAEEMNIPVVKDAVARAQYTESQTKKTRVERWQNIEGRFELVNASAISGRHILLVDDVITTGATLEACGRALLQAQNVQLSIAALCYSTS